MRAVKRTVWDEGEKGAHVRGVRLAGFARESHASALLFVKPILRKHDDCLAVELTCMTNCP